MFLRLYFLGIAKTSCCSFILPQYISTTLPPLWRPFGSRGLWGGYHYTQLQFGIGGAAGSFQLFILSGWCFCRWLTAAEMCASVEDFSASYCLRNTLKYGEFAQTTLFCFVQSTDFSAIKERTLRKPLSLCYTKYTKIGSTITDNMRGRC